MCYVYYTYLMLAERCRVCGGQSVVTWLVVLKGMAQVDRLATYQLLLFPYEALWLLENLCAFIFFPFLGVAGTIIQCSIVYDIIC